MPWKSLSHWRLDVVFSLELNIVPYKPLSSKKYLKLPLEIQHLKGIVNIQNDDEKCFLWSVLAARHPVENKYWKSSALYHVWKRAWFGRYQLSDTHFTNPNVWEKKTIFPSTCSNLKNKKIPLYISQLHLTTATIDRLHIRQNGNSHYCLIKDLNRVLGSTKRCKNRHYCSRRCLHGFIREDLLNEHTS